MADGMEIEVAAPNAIQLAEDRFTEEQRAAVARFLSIDADDPALLPYLGIAAHYGLDPVMGQVWLIPKKEKAKDGKPEREWLQPTIGRDGYLAIARKQKDFLGMQGDVVCEHDSFDVEWDGTLDAPRVLHRPASKPTQFASDVDPSRWRGRILGAWCKVWIKGRAAQYYYAPLREHAKVWHANDGRSGFSGAWSYTSAMILKSAQSVCLRLAFGITGFVPADEIRDEIEGEVLSEEDVAQAQDIEAGVVAFRGLELDVPDDLAEQFCEALIEMNRLAPRSWGPAKVELILRGAGQEKVEQVLGDLEGEIKIALDREADRRDREAADQAHAAAEAPDAAPEDDGVVDAEVVEEEAPAEEPLNVTNVIAADVKVGDAMQWEFEGDEGETWWEVAAKGETEREDESDPDLIHFVLVRSVEGGEDVERDLDLVAGADVVIRG